MMRAYGEIGRHGGFKIPCGFPRIGSSPIRRIRAVGEIGKRKGLKIPREHSLAGSIPAPRKSLGRRQAVSPRILVPVFVGSSPTAPVSRVRMATARLKGGSNAKFCELLAPFPLPGRGCIKGSFPSQ